MSTAYDLVIRGGTIVDGTGQAPIIGDVAVAGGKIAAIGKIDGAGAQEIDARDRIVTPGFVDIHTHYDGQAIWSERLSPSSSHGVTTVVMGNCGVGFAPCRAADHALLIKVMEGVEDIPEVVMAEGLPWTWETFPQYLDALDARQHDIDVAAYLPHSPLRVYVMGQRGADRAPATPEDLAKMRDITRAAMEAGAMGFATSRLVIHRTADGRQIPTFDAATDELKAITAGMADAGRGTLQIVLDAFRGMDNELPILREVVESCRRPATFTIGAGNAGPPNWTSTLANLSAATAAGLPITGQVLPRPIGLVCGLELTIHPFVTCPSYRAVAQLPHTEMVKTLRDPELRRKLISETPEPGHPLTAMGRTWAWMFPLNDPPDYAQPLSNSMAAQAQAQGRTPEEVAYDWMLERDGHALMYVALGNFHDGKLDAVYEMLTHPDCVIGLGDGGAHYGAICDASFPTSTLNHWVRDSGRISLAAAVRMLSRRPAEAVGLRDRGLLRPGYKADINVIDAANLKLHIPTIVRDLPAGGRRLDQRATGYDATIVAGLVIRRNDEATGVLPGRLVRGPQAERP
ncbi:MAG: amidohydrolase family protein [Rhodospirillaceae bacterium]|nr:amidohydrolase family protein [Rhodospirillaceae bacterium]